MRATDGRGVFPASYAPASLVMQIVGLGLLIGTLATAREGSVAVWAVYAASFACWFVFHFLVENRPRAAGIALVLSAALPAATAGWAHDSTAVIMVSVVLGRFTAWHRPRTAALWMVVGGCLLLTLLTSAAGGAGLGDLAGYTVMLLLLTLLGLNQRQYQLRAHQAEQLLDQANLMQQEQAQVAVLGERARIAREIHDVLAHSLGALTVQLKAADSLLDNGDIDGARARVQRSNRLADDGLAEAAAAVAALRDDVIPLPDMLADLVEHFGRDHHTEVRLTTSGTVRPLPSGPVVALVRAAREALTNAAKHAPGGAVTVALDYGTDQVRLEVCNDIPRPKFVDDGPPVSGYGLTGMRERLALVGGTLETGPDDTQRSWRLAVEVAT